MRIPLDYYRILGLPIQATAEQLQQAHRDRALQLPRREYSEAAIAARKQLLDEAYAVLSDPDQRQTYDSSFLAKTYDLEPESSGVTTKVMVGEAGDQASDLYAPSIDIQDDQLVGALLIFLELGEYELVLKLGRNYLTRRNSVKSGAFGEPDIAFTDIVLTVALACLELGREQWQQGQYENAAESLEAGQELLLREGLFASVRGEIQSDLYKLRPYRVLELLALPEDSTNERRQGLRLLREMLQERGGIDGTGTDQSGLNIDDFLRFIQQLRGYLTAAEQQTLFEEEARRPSAVATYLAVYALLARGFAQREPALIRRAKSMLVRLGVRQDVHLEQGVCALLLGQTEEASRALELSHEVEPIAYIRENSQGSPDLLPGLCLYSERWLQEEVFPHFRDLSQQQVSLKDYFADEQVQAYLEELPNEDPVEKNNAGATSRSHSSNGATAASTANSAGSWRDLNTYSAAHSATTRLQPDSDPAIAPPTRTPEPPAAPLERTVAQTSVSVPAPIRTPGDEPISVVPSREPSPSTVRRSPTRDSNGSIRDRGDRYRGQVANGFRVPDAEDLPPRRSGSSAPASEKKPQLLVILLGLLGLGILGYLTTKVFTWVAASLQGPAVPALEADQPMVQLSRPPVTIPASGATAETSSGPLTQESAQQIIQTWLTAKAEALGANHQVDKLNQILANPALSEWQELAEDAKQSNSYRRYQHSIKAVNSVQMSDVDANQARIEAEVSEAAEFYVNGQVDAESSYNNDSLRVRYDLVRQNGQWRIQAMDVLQ